VRVSVKILARGETVELELPEGTTVKKLMEVLKIDSTRSIVIKNAEALPENYVLKEGDKITVLPIVSGG